MPHDRLLDVLSSTSRRARPLLVVIICVVDRSFVRSFVSFLRARCAVPRWFRRPSVVPLTTRPAAELKVGGSDGVVQGEAAASV